jgi:undecaprenyl diphosphate synthase
MHVGIIMDGNGRWAAAKGLPRLEGHRRGVEALRQAVRSAIDLKIDTLTVYSFSTENWSRPVQEVSDLMGLLKRFIRNDIADLHRQNVRVRIIGERLKLSADIRALLDEAEQISQNNTGLTLVVAFNYGGRQELTGALRRICAEALAGSIQLEDISAEMIGQHLDTADLPDPDFIIRTSGEQRLSNFLLWQSAYAEFVFLPMHWPDFDYAAFEGALCEFRGRERRFGNVTTSTRSAL